MGKEDDVENMEKDESDKPLQPVVIIENCGQINEGEDDGCVVDEKDPYPLFPESSTVADKISAANAIRELGNVEFKEGNMPKAIAKYDKALRYLQEEFSSPQEEVDMAKARASCLSNRAACHLKLKNYTKVVADCQAVLSIESDNVKAHFRMAQAYEQPSAVHDLELAKKYYTEASKLSPDDKAIKQYLERCKKALVAERQKMSQKFSKMFG